MKSVTISDFRSHIQEYLQGVQKGADIVLTSHGKSIAKVVPVPNNSEIALERLRGLSKTAKIFNILDPVSVSWNENQ